MTGSIHSGSKLTFASSPLTSLPLILSTETFLVTCKMTLYCLIGGVPFVLPTRRK